MRIAELSRHSGVPIPTIKYYLREGILPPGEFTSPNQARYDERHVQRLRLIRALVDVGRLPIATIRQLLTDLDRPGRDPHRMLGKTLRAVEGVGETAGDHKLTAADDEVERLIARRGWHVGPESPARRAVSELIATLRHLGMDDIVGAIDEYAEVAERAAAVDVELVRRRGEPDAMVYTAVIGTVLGDRLMAGLRHLAQEDASARTLRREQSACQ